MNPDEAVIHEIHHNRSLKIPKFFAESAPQTSKPSAAHPQRAALLPDG
jgi:hypothetical protein